MSFELKGQVNSFLKHAFKCGLCSKLYTIEAIADDADMELFCKMANLLNCVHSVLLPVKSCNHYLRHKGHMYELPRYDSEMHKKSFVPRCLFKYRKSTEAQDRCPRDITSPDGDKTCLL